MKVCKAPRKEFETHTHAHMHSNISFWIDYHREFLDISYSLLCVFFFGLRHFGCDISVISRRFPPTKGAPAFARRQPAGSTWKTRLPKHGNAWAVARHEQIGCWVGVGYCHSWWWQFSLFCPERMIFFRFFRPGCLQKYEDVEKFCMEVILYTTCFCLLNMSCAWLII